MFTTVSVVVCCVSMFIFELVRESNTVPLGSVPSDPQLSLSSSQFSFVHVCTKESMVFQTSCLPPVSKSSGNYCRCVCVCVCVCVQCVCHMCYMCVQVCACVMYTCRCRCTDDGPSTPRNSRHNLLFCHLSLGLAVYNSLFYMSLLCCVHFSASCRESGTVWALFQCWMHQESGTCM